MAPIEPSRQLTRLTSAEVGDQTRTRHLDMSRQVISPLRVDVSRTAHTSDLQTHRWHTVLVAPGKGQSHPITSVGRRVDWEFRMVGVNV